MISIIIPAYNEENYISKTIDSILSQSFKDYEIISVLNGCKDKTKDNAKNSRIIEIKEKNVSLARNTGAKVAKGSILVFLDADTQLTKNSLEEINKIMKKATVATCNSLPDKNNLVLKFFHKFKSTFYFFNWSGGIIIVKKDIFEKIKGFDINKSKGEDSDLIRRTKKYGKYKKANTYVINSTRRYAKWGYLKTILFWTKERFFPSKEEYESIR